MSCYDTRRDGHGIILFSLSLSCTSISHMQLLALFRRESTNGGMWFGWELTFFSHTVTYYLAISKHVKSGKNRINAFLCLIYNTWIGVYLLILVTCSYSTNPKSSTNYCFFLCMQIRLLAVLIHGHLHMNIKKRSRGVMPCVLLTDGVLRGQI